MNCANVRETLADYSVGLVSARKMKAIEAHLSACPECAGELRAIRRAGELIEMLPAQTPPDGLWDSLSYRLAHERAATARPAPSPLWLRPAVALAMAAVAALGVWRPWSDTLPPTSASVTSSYVQAHLANAPVDMLGGEISRGLVLAESVEAGQ